MEMVVLKISRINPLTHPPHPLPHQAPIRGAAVAFTGRGAGSHFKSLRQLIPSFLLLFRSVNVWYSLDNYHIKMHVGVCAVVVGTDKAAGVG